MRINNKKVKRTIYVAVLFLLAVNMFVTIPVIASIKSVACEAVGCPNGSRVCAEVGMPPLVYTCYENPPMN